jgi:hypothetical protein
MGKNATWRCCLRCNPKGPEWRKCGSRVCRREIGGQERGKPLQEARWPPACGNGGETREGTSPPFDTIAMDEEFRLGKSARTANPAQTTAFSGVKKGFLSVAVELGNPVCKWIGPWHIQPQTKPTIPE